MNIHDEILKIKELSALDKLIIGLILDTHPSVLNLRGGYYCTAGDIAKKLGTTRKKVLLAIESMVANSYLISDVELGRRITNVTEKVIQILFPFYEPSEQLKRYIADEKEEDEEEDLSFLD